MAVIAGVSPTDLIRTSTFGVPVITELNSRCIKVTGVTETGGPITGSLIINALPAMKLRHSGNTPYFQFENSTGATRYGFIQGAASQMNYVLDAASSSHRFVINSALIASFDPAGLDVTGQLTTSGGGAFGGNGLQVACIDTVAGGNSSSVGFYGDGTLAAPGTLNGFVGYGGNTTLQLRNQLPAGAIQIFTAASGPVNIIAGAGGAVTLTTTGAGRVDLDSGGPITISQGGVERGRVNGSLMWGKSVGGHPQPGAELFESGAIYSTTANNTVPNLLLRHNTNADDVAYVQFMTASGSIPSEINQDNTAPIGIKITGCAVSAPSDYRLKDDLGPVVDAVDRVMQLQPKHLAWKETGHEFDGFLAHEVAEVVPDAVSGEKDAVYDDAEAERMGVYPGAVKAQQLDQLQLVPLLTAALHELADRVTALEDM